MYTQKINITCSNLVAHFIGHLTILKKNQVSDLSKVDEELFII